MYPCNTCCSSDIDVFYHFKKLPHSFHTKFYTWICIANNHPNRSSESVEMCNWISANIIIIIEIIDLVSRTSSKYTFCVNSALRTFWFASLDSHIPSISMWTILFIANAILQIYSMYFIIQYMNLNLENFCHCTKHATRCGVCSWKYSIFYIV